jgi:hypothetical protein
LLLGRGIRPEVIRKRLADGTEGATRVDGLGRRAGVEEIGERAVEILNQFLKGLKSMSSKDLMSYFAEKAQFIDVSGRRREREQIEKEFEALSAPYAKKNAVFVVEPPHTQTRQVFVGSMVWKNALLASERRGWMQRMGFVMLLNGEDWEIVFAQVTAVQTS